jgi:hypothetical protein
MKLVMKDATWWPDEQRPRGPGLPVYTAPMKAFGNSWQTVLDCVANPYLYDAFLFENNADIAFCRLATVGHEFDAVYIQRQAAVNKVELERLGFYRMKDMKYEEFVSEPGKICGKVHKERRK